MRKPGVIDKAHGCEYPVVVLDADAEIFSISGDSEPENAKEFFADIFIWLEMYSLCPLKNQSLIVDLTGFNSSSSLYLLKLFEMWLSIDNSNSVTWKYHSTDDSMLKAGEEYAEMVGGRFLLEAKKETTV